MRLFRTDDMEVVTITLNKDECIKFNSACQSSFKLQKKRDKFLRKV